jgi:hypothetical protein
MTSIRLVADPIQSLAAVSIGAAYMGIGPRFDRAARMILVNNFTDGLMMFSWNGVNDHFPLPVYTSLLLSIAQNADDIEEHLLFPAQSRLYVRQINAPTTGSVYITQFRGVNDA